MSFLIHSSLVWPLTIESLRFTILSYKIPLPPLKNNTVFENHRKSRIQQCERSELRLHFEWTKVNKNAKKLSIWRLKTVLPQRCEKKYRYLAVNLGNDFTTLQLLKNR